jgi:hypothetical protein
MTITCGLCSKTYDDAERLTYCPHDRFMPKEDLKRKMHALDLIGREVRFAHQPEGPYFRVQSVDHIGMVSLDGFVGEFAPHLFVPK